MKKGEIMSEITKILVANRGEIASRILRTLDCMGIAGAVVYHPVDATSPAVKMAAQAVEINGCSPVAAYLDMENIITACNKIGADAVHPGFGFLAENAGFAERLAEEGIVFIGPLPDTMALMGNKLTASAFCMENGFPVLPCVSEQKTGKTFAAGAREIGVPLLIKAAAGGGGKGMHIVNDFRDFDTAVLLAKAEALRFFGSNAVYAEKYVASPRHIEVQIMADHHGHVLHMGERDCSIQRRFQKIIEESPAPGLAPALRRQICDTAVEIARKSGYRNAGTVEFILAPDGQFYFLEMNTRLQVEHPVTEMVTGLDLVELQVRAARNESFSLTQDDIKTNGHAIELRLYAEDPEKEFMPATGQLLAYHLPRGKGIRVENGFAEGMQVSAAFDPMLAKLIVHDTNRKKTIDRALQALRDTLVLGVTTNADFLMRILSHPAYGAGRVHTGFIPLHQSELLPPPLTREQRSLLLAAAALSSREFMDTAFAVPEPHAFLGNWRN
jgi:acetyl-CoA/propionyl-CoA carboxylase, biotin carboxylase, biotin carboxyl carrier protein